MIAEDFGPVRVLATESIAGTTVEVARARTGPKDRRGRGQRNPVIAQTQESRYNHMKCEVFRHGTKQSGEKCGLGMSAPLGQKQHRHLRRQTDLDLATNAFLAR